MDRNGEHGRTTRARFSLSQETITIVTVGVALAGLMLALFGDLRAEARADRQAFANQIIRLVEQQGTLNGLVDGLRQSIPPPED